MFLFRLYNIYYTFYINYLIQILVCFNLALAIFEKPAVSGYELPYWVSTYNNYFSFRINSYRNSCSLKNNTNIAFKATMIMEYICIFVFALCMFHKWYIAPDGCFWYDKKNKILSATIIVSISRIFKLKCDKSYKKQFYSF